MKLFKHLCCLLLLTICLIACKKTTKSDYETSVEGANVEKNAVTIATSFPKPNIGCKEVPESWFSGNVPTPDPSSINKNSTNCDFHLLSWQYFLWLTEEVNGQLRFETMFTNKAITPEYKNDTYHVLDVVEQALSKGMLVDQNGRAVYSSIIIDSVFQNFVLKNKLYDRETMAAFDPNTGFPPGSLSLKTSWKIVQEGEDTSKLYTQKSDIELLTMVDGQPRIDKDNPQIQTDVEVALVGLHIAFVPDGHDEFVWATFEFDGNAPDFPENVGLNTPVSPKDWLLYAANTTARDVNTDNAGILKFADQSKQTLTPITQVARQYKNGGGTPKNQTHIMNLNASVKEQLTKNNSIWKNYFEVGAIWFNNPDLLKPNWNPNVVDSILTGSLQLSNSTIETFTQKIVSENECFSCHNTQAVTDVPPTLEMLGGKNINLSHVLLKNYIEGTEAPPTKPENN
ncbi:hypothetical protein [uncultured Dokdonia sp.]|uniref:hypothetical protein n=1 Tax=uncultured Dokdonia sp. TaxID=575653 RepID=UPI00260A94EE|nr:hypothetical protein [uncultured Dokdonia sp.]